MIEAIYEPAAKRRHIQYPESDGKPLAETDIHVLEIVSLLEVLREYFKDDADVYVAGNNFIYFQDGDIAKRVSPDVYVVFGVEKKLRRTFKTWIEQAVPAVVFEVSSRKTRREDTEKKWHIYAALGVKEYFLYDPEDDYLKPPLQGHRLVRGFYHRIKPDKDGFLLSKELGMKFRLEQGLIQLYDIQTGKRLMRAAEVRNQVSQAEQELARLREELARLKHRG
jgi:Uma2 family endonuclease